MEPIISSLYIRASNWMDELKSFTSASVSLLKRPDQSFISVLLVQQALIYHSLHLDGQTEEVDEALCVLLIVIALAECGYLL